MFSKEIQARVGRFEGEKRARRKFYKKRPERIREGEGRKTERGTENSCRAIFTFRDTRKDGRTSTNSKKAFGKRKICEECTQGGKDCLSRERGRMVLHRFPQRGGSIITPHATRLEVAWNRPKTKPSGA